MGFISAPPSLTPVFLIVETNVMSEWGTYIFLPSQNRSHFSHVTYLLNITSVKWLVHYINPADCEMQTIHWRLLYVNIYIHMLASRRILTWHHFLPLLNVNVSQLKQFITQTTGLLETVIYSLLSLLMFVCVNMTFPLLKCTVVF